jgi:hypothetical protein
MMQVSIRKNGERFLFRWQRGGEDDILGAMVDLAESGRTCFDMVDVLILSRRVAAERKCYRER